MKINKIYFDEDFWHNIEIRKLPNSALILIINLLFLSCKYNHKPFCIKIKDFYSECNTYKMDFWRKKDNLLKIGIDVKIVNTNEYCFDLSVFFKKYYK